MIGYRTAALVLALLIVARSSDGYEFSTHAAMTREAVRLSRVGDGSALAQLGLTERGKDLGKSYIDASATNGDFARSSNPANPVDFSKNKIAFANAFDNTGEKPDVPSFTGWVMLGAIREDDVALSAGSLENTPQDDPSGTQNKSSAESLL